MFAKLLASSLTLSLFTTLNLCSLHPQQQICHCYPQEFEKYPEPFEKIYISSCSLVSTPHGRYYRNSQGALEKVSALASDCNGLYILRIYRQCADCGRVYADLPIPEGWNCLQS